MGTKTQTIKPREWLTKHWPWLVVALAVALNLVVRVHLRHMPLERDEGEYAYAGQLMLQGVPPYRDASNMKLPGTYVAYALIMAAFGQTVGGIHIGVALFTSGSIILVFLIGKRLLDDITGAASAMSFAMLSLSPYVLGLSGHATHFVTFFALAGLYLMLCACPAVFVQGPRRSLRDMSMDGSDFASQVRRWYHSSPRSSGARPPIQPEPPGENEDEPDAAAPDSGRKSARETPEFGLGLLFASGLLLGLAFLMKQHGVFFALFGFGYLLIMGIATRWALASPARRAVFRVRNRGGVPPLPPPYSKLWIALGVFALGCTLPYLVTCLCMWIAGVFHQFWFWTTTYASKYASSMPLVNGPAMLKASLGFAVGPSLAIWLLPWFGALVMWWDERLDGTDHGAQTGRSMARRSKSSGQSAIRYPRFFLTVLFVTSFASASIGFYFRPHYFITWLPALALLSGLAVSRAIHLVRNDRTIELFLAVPILILASVALIGTMVGNGAIWFGSDLRAHHATYKSSIFFETQKAADYIRDHTEPSSRVAVLGSEPEIYFLARRRSATSYLYTYPLMERQPFALKMQKEMISEIETNRPEYVVYVHDNVSWSMTGESDPTILGWWEGYWASNLDLVVTLPVDEGVYDETQTSAEGWRSGAGGAGSSSRRLLVLKRRGGK